MRLPLDAILLTAGTQQRTSINEAAVSEYAEVYMAGGTLPKPVVFFDGTDYILAGGFHRYHAARQAGLSELVVDLRQGTRREAVLFAVGDNATHGLRRTNEDKRKAARTLLEDAEWGKWSDTEIARRCAVSHEFVRQQRASLSTVASENSAPATRTVRTKHGTETQMDVSNIGKAKAPMPVPMPMPAAKPGKPAPADEPDPEAADKLATALEMAHEVMQDNTRLLGEIKAAEADDQKAETLKWRRSYDNAVREQSLAMERASESVKREAFTKRQLMRCGKAVGETNPDKIAPKVEAMARAAAKVTA
jgi:hypothetical protein